MSKIGETLYTSAKGCACNGNCKCGGEPAVKAAEPRFRVGDEFDVRMTVLRSEHRGYYPCSVSGAFNTWTVNHEVLASAVPVARPLAVGEKVVLRFSPALSGTLVAVDGKEGWIRWDESRAATPVWPLTDLCRA